MAMAMMLFVSLSASAQVLTSFYKYTTDGEGYKVELTTAFKTQLNKESEGKLTSGSYTWETGDPLPNPAPNGMYNGKKVTSMASLFSLCYAQSLDLSNFNTDNVTDMSSMFIYCVNLTSLNLSSFNTTNVTNMNAMFSMCEKMTSLDLSKFNTANVTDMTGMFYNCEKLTTLNLGKPNTAKVTTMRNMFGGCSALTSVDVSTFNTAEVTDMSGMFAKCSALTSLDLSSFNTAKVTAMTQMFTLCENLESLDLTSFNTANVTDMSAMFSGCNAMTKLNVTSFKTDKVTNMDDMFMQCYALEALNVSSFNTANVTSMKSMFGFCRTLDYLDLSNFKTDNVENMAEMFNRCLKLKGVDVSSFNTANVTDMSFMFSTCWELGQLDIDNFNTSKVENMDCMFEDCKALKWIKMSEADFTNVTVSTDMFENCGLIYDGKPARVFVKNQAAKKFLEEDVTKIDDTRLTIVAKTVVATVTAVGGATLSSEHDLDFSTLTNVKAYAVTVVDGKLTLTERKQCRSDEGVLLLANEAVEVEIPWAGKSVDKKADNDLLPGGFNSLASESESGGVKYYNYILNNGENGLAFYKANGQKVAEGKAYLKLTADKLPADAKVLTFDFDGNTTAIDQLKADTTTTDGAIYNLAGQRVKKAGKGIYIVGGKKVVMK